MIDQLYYKNILYNIMEEFKKYKTKPQVDHYDIEMDEYNDIDGVKWLSVVDKPAIEVTGIYFKEFSDINEGFKFKEVDTEKGILAGPSMIPDIKIPRKDKVRGLFTVSFSKEQIEIAQRKFSRNQYGNNINFDHTDQKVKAFVLEQWIITDPAFDKSRTFGYNLPIGTWFTMVKFDDMDFYRDVVKNGYHSFSIEMDGKLKASFKDIREDEKDEFDKLLSEFEEILNELKIK